MSFLNKLPDDADSARAIMKITTMSSFQVQRTEQSPVNCWVCRGAEGEIDLQSSICLEVELKYYMAVLRKMNGGI